MDGDVVDLDGRRKLKNKQLERTAEPDQLECVCGNTWWHLAAVLRENPDVPGTFQVIGFNGHIACLHCGKERDLQ